MDWMAFFDEFFQERMPQLEQIAAAGGCREGWVQGEMYLFAKSQGLDLRTNVPVAKYDLQCDQEDRQMCGEIKFCGDDYSPKMKGLILADADRLVSGPPTHRKFLILIIDRQEKRTNLGKWLEDLGKKSIVNKGYREQVLTGKLAVKIWQI